MFQTDLKPKFSQIFWQLFAVSDASDLNKPHGGLNAQIAFNVSKRPELLNHAVSFFS